MNAQPVPPQRAIALRWTPNKVAAVGAFLLGCLFTALFIREIAPQLTIVVAYLIALPLQLLLSLSQRNLWRLVLRKRGGSFNPFALLTTIFDAFLNGSGLYPLRERLGGTNMGKMIAEPLELQPTVDARSGAFICFFIGLIVAGGVEALWSLDDETIR